ncbi:MAG: outer membrane beta-barrel domain-containing protein [Burkholderiaceae bacterium]|uniref:Outer membrane beta-barrel domain-containing protein n=1 Tax=Rubrivivax albus TaxID=2499835 RepID=A0A3S2VVJ7_9BURK|nr:outer membrane beta-barrel domain-containing protein [Rubrivivax albus]MCP5272797.1 outer membrane beta-barrel domain-containing protein [Burkholderiaceae bacterium]RVT50025.1 outer membrane beta-barrel domain-containing protein [Rubrivivax albus]
MRRTLTALLLSTTALTALPVLAQTRPADEPPIVPEVERRELRLPRFPSRDFEVGAFVGTYATENFGASAVYGLRLGYHLTEDWFFEGTFGSTQVSDASFRQILPGGIFTSEKERLSYYSVSAGYNLLPGEVFLGSRQARATAIYLVGGVGSTDFAGQKRQTFHVGFGWRILLGDRGALRVDLRDHIFSLDLLGQNQSTQNLEASVGFGFHF